MISNAVDMPYPLSDQAIRARFAGPLRQESTRLLYQGSQIPTLLLLLNGLACGWLLGPFVSTWLLSSWLVWLVIIAGLRLFVARAFNKADPASQQAPLWRSIFLIGAFLSGLTLSVTVIALLPEDDYVKQALVYGLIAATVLSASVAYAVSLRSFLVFALPCLVPSVTFLLLSDSSTLRSWGLLSMVLALALIVVAVQINRVVQSSLLRRFQTQALLDSLEQARIEAETLNLELSDEVEQRRQAERKLREARDLLEIRVAERTLELDEATVELDKSQTRLSLALEASELGLWDWDLQTDQVHQSRLEDLFGLREEEVRTLRADLTPRLHPDDVAQLKHSLIEHLKGHTDSYSVEYRFRHSNGQWIWIEDHGRAIEWDEHGRTIRMIGTRRNITVRKQLEQEQQLAARVFEVASEGIVILDARYRFLSVNEAFTRVTGYRSEDVLGHSVMSMVSSQDSLRQYQQIRHELETSSTWQGELLESRKNGELYPQWLRLDVVRDGRGRISHVVGFFTDLSARREVEERLRYLSHYDALTGLANRSLLSERLHEAAQRVRNGAQGLALLHINLDRFKMLNDSIGHELADQLLRQMSRRLNQTLSEADTIARLSSDEFAVILDNYGSLASLARLASRLLTKLRMPMELGGHELIISASMGISLLPDNTREASTLLNQANMAMQHAKHLGGNTFQFFTDNLQACTLERLQLETQLRRAIEEGQLEVYYQPKLNLATEQLDAAEALVRWNHPQLGLVPPGDFIGLAEETGLINAIGEFVLRKACQQARLWQLCGQANIRVSVNLSVHQLRQGKLANLVRQVLDESGLPAAMLELELTESQLLDNVDGVDNVIRTLQQLHDLGVRLSIDDFGTGYSSLSYLKRFPVDYVKIDQSFIRNMTPGSEDATITRAIIAMVHSLELKVVAEGVETAAQLEYLRSLNCDEVQGFLISPALNAESFIKLLEVPLQMA